MRGERPRVRRIWQEDGRTLGIGWTTGTVCLYDVVAMRRACPCAHCVSETSGERTLDPASIPESVRPTRIASVGRYALTIAFSDGHDTGIYTFSGLHDDPEAWGGRPVTPSTDG